MRHVAIIGNGISGVTVARNLRKGDSNVRITLISAESPYFFSRTALMYVYMGHMKFEHTQPYESGFWKKNRIDLIQDYVQSLEFESKTLQFSSGKSLKYDELVIATGSKPNRFGWPGQDLKGVQGLYSFQDLQLLEENTHPPLCKEKDRKVKNAVIVGGGLIGVELAEMLMSRNIQVHFLVRESKFWGNVLTEAEGDLISAELRHHGVNLMMNTELKEIQGNSEGRVESIIDSHGNTIACEFVGLTAGVSPNIDFMKGTKLAVDRGIIVDEYLQTNIDSVYALGDCAQFSTAPAGRRNIEQVWYTGRMMGEVLAKTLLGEQTSYNPGPWFNSAKFFEIEYQTYGQVSSIPEENEARFYWEHENGDKAMTLVFDSKSRLFIGLNVFGIRLRHEMMDRWLRNGVSVDYVLEHLSDANFDPEFYQKHEKSIINQFNTEFSTNVVPKRKSWKRILGKIGA